MIRTVLFSLLAVFLCTSAEAGSVDVTATGMFSAGDTPDTFVAPGDTFSLSFLVNTNPILTSSDYTLNSFDVPVSSFTYSLDGVPVSLTPGETPDDITFYTLANGGGFEVDFPSAEFLFGGDQMFSGPTSAPVFSTGSFPGTSWTFLDTNNVDTGTGRVAITPEPSFMPILLCGIAILAFKSRRFIQAR